MTLGELRPGEKAKVVSLGTTGAMRQRILDMGGTPNVQVIADKKEGFMQQQFLSLTVPNDRL